MPLKSDVENYYKDLRFPLRVQLSEDVYLEDYWYYEAYIGGVHMDDVYERIFISIGLLGLVYVFDYDRQFKYVLELYDSEGRYVEPLGVSTMPNGDIIIGAWGSYVFHFDKAGLANKPALKLSDRNEGCFARQVKAIDNEYFITGIHDGGLYAVHKDLEVARNLTEGHNSPAFGSFYTIAISPLKNLICGGTASYKDGFVYLYCEGAFGSWKLDSFCNAITFSDDGDIYVGTASGRIYRFVESTRSFYPIAITGISIATGADRLINELIILGDHSGLVYGYSIITGETSIIASCGAIINSIEVSNKNQKILVGCEDGKVLLLSLDRPIAYNKLLYQNKVDALRSKGILTNASAYLREIENCYYTCSQQLTFDILERDHTHFDDQFLELMCLRLVLKVKKDAPVKLIETIIAKFGNQVLPLPVTNTLDHQFFSRLSDEMQKIRTLDINAGFEKTEDYLFLRSHNYQVKKPKYKSDEPWVDMVENEKLTFGKAMPEPLAEELETDHPYYTFFAWKHRADSLETIWNHSPNRDTNQHWIDQINEVYYKLVDVACRLPEKYFLQVAVEASEKARARLSIEDIWWKGAGRNADNSRLKTKKNASLPLHISLLRIQQHLQHNELILHFHYHAPNLKIFLIERGVELILSEDANLIDETIIRALASMGKKIYGKKILISLDPEIFRRDIIHALNMHLLSQFNSSCSFTPAITIAMVHKSLTTNKQNDPRVLIISDPLADLGAVAKLEALAVEKHFLPSNAHSITGRDITLDSINELLSDCQYDIIHFICHGSDFDEQEGKNYIQLGKGERLYPGDLLKFNLNGATVILSTCFSGKTITRVRGEIEGIVRSLLLAGAGSILATTDLLDSVMSYEYMSGLYNEWIAGGMEFGDAVRTVSVQQRVFNFYVFGALN